MTHDYLLTYLHWLGCCIYCSGISIGTAKLKIGLCFANSAKRTRYKSIYMPQTGQWTKPATCLLGRAKPSVFSKKFSDRENEFCYFLMWNLYTKRTCCSRPTIKDCKWTVQFNQWLTLWDQFTNNLFHMNIFKKPSWSSKLPTEFEESVFDQLKGLVEGIRDASIFKLCCFALLCLVALLCRRRNIICNFILVFLDLRF